MVRFWKELIHLLKTFIEAKNTDPEVMKWQTIIHMAFIASAIGLVWIDKMSASTAQMSHTARA